MPNGTLTYRRGDICWINLDPALGVETQKTRPCLIIQNDEYWDQIYKAINIILGFDIVKTNHH